LGVQIKLQTVS